MADSVYEPFEQPQPHKCVIQDHNLIHLWPAPSDRTTPIRLFSCDEYCRYCKPGKTFADNPHTEGPLRRHIRDVHYKNVVEEKNGGNKAYIAQRTKRCIEIAQKNRDNLPLSESDEEFIGTPKKKVVKTKKRSLEIDDSTIESASKVSKTSTVVGQAAAAAIEPQSGVPNAPTDTDSVTEIKPGRYRIKVPGGKIKEAWKVGDKWHANIRLSKHEMRLLDLFLEESEDMV